MAKPKKKVTDKPKAQDQKGPPLDSDWEAVGDHWEEMQAFNDVGDFFEGVYVSSVNNVGPNKSMVHIFDVIGIRTGVWGSTVLDRRMDSVKLGHMARITYQSNEINPATGRTYKDFEVLQKKRPEKGFEHLTEPPIPF